MGLFNFKKEKMVFDQDLSQMASESHVFMMWLLFDKEPVRPSVKAIKGGLEDKFGEVDTVSEKDGLSSFAIKKYRCNFKEGALPPQVVIGGTMPFKQEKITDFERNQLWNVTEGDALLRRCTHQILIFDMMNFQDYKNRCELLMDWLEAAVVLFPDCTAVWIPTAGKLFTANEIREHKIPRENRFIYFGVNARFFNIQGSEDMVVDTYGMYAMDLPDVQYHFHDLDPNAVVNHAYNVASYIFSDEHEIVSGETIDGLEGNVVSQDIQWKCQYEDALIQPIRTVLDVCPGKFASGARK